MNVSLRTIVPQRQSVRIVKHSESTHYLGDRKDFDVSSEGLRQNITLPEIWDKMAEIMQIIIHYGDQIRL